MAAAVATNVIEGQRTSSPGPTSEAFSARNRAAVPFETATASLVPVSSANAFSNAWVRDPAVIQAESSVPRISASSLSSNSSSDSRAFHMRFQKSLRQSWEIFVSLLVVVRPADILPICFAFISQDRLVVCKQPLNQFRKVEFL